MLLNIDKPNRTATLHREECNMIPDPIGTLWKLVEKMGRDSGWFSVESETEARAVATGSYRRPLSSAASAAKTR